METRKVYIPTPYVNDLTKNLNIKGLAVDLDKESCAAGYAGRFGRDLDECRRMLSKISEYDLHYLNDADFTPENMLWRFEDAVPPVITVYLAFNFTTEKIVGVYTKSAIKAFPMECLQDNCIMLPVVCDVSILHRKEA